MRADLYLFGSLWVAVIAVSPNVGSRRPDQMPGSSSSPYGQVPEKRELSNSAPLGDFWTSPGAEIFTGKLKGSSTSSQLACPPNQQTPPQQAGVAAPGRSSSTDAKSLLNLPPKCNDGIVLPPNKNQNKK